MTRTFSPAGSTNTTRLDPDAVAEFFEARANRIEEVGPMRAVIYQDKQHDLAARRDAVEVACLMPLLRLDGRQQLLDVGCGTGRWTGRVAPLVASYHGIDFSAGLLDHARKTHEAQPHCGFTRMRAEDISRNSLGESAFDRILCAGVCIYLNDDELIRMLTGMGQVAMPVCRIVLREPVGLNSRLTLAGHYSEELEHDYHAIYRTESELERMIETTLGTAGFKPTARGDVYERAEMNNRVETRQRWLLLERHE